MLGERRGAVPHRSPERGRAIPFVDVTTLGLECAGTREQLRRSVEVFLTEPHEAEACERVGIAGRILQDLFEFTCARRDFHAAAWLAQRPGAPARFLDEVSGLRCKRRAPRQVCLAAPQQHVASRARIARCHIRP